MQARKKSSTPTGNERQMPQPFTALALQTSCVAISTIKDVAESRRMIMQNLQRVAGQVAASKTFIGSDCRLIVLPEYFLSGFPMGDPIAVWREKACLEIDGPEYEALAEVASKQDIYLAGNAYEIDPHFPKLYFQTCFIISPAGEVVLRYRRLNSMFAPTPHDVWDQYLDIYGSDGVFPVARTEIGNLAAIASEEILYPELARCLALRGAEIFVHPTSQSNETVRAPKDVATAARAIENLAYVVSANSAGIHNTPLPAASADGGSKIVDYKGLVQVASGPGESMTAYAALDIQGLRCYRRRPGMENLLSRQRFELYAPEYAAAQIYPANTMVAIEPDRKLFLENQQKAIQRLIEKGIIIG